MKNNGLRRAASLVLTGALVFGGSPAAAFAAEEPQHVLEVQNTGHWVKAGNRWWFEYTDGGYPTNCYLTISGTRYAFDAEGWMVVGWHNWPDGTWSYSYSSGALADGWAFIGGKWYHFTDNDMDTSWFTDGSGVYYLGTSGAMSQGWRKIGDYWYYFKGSGARATGWVLSGGFWYYFDSLGQMQVGLEDIGGATYFLENEYDDAYHPYGAMYQDEWVNWTNGKRSYFGPDGSMARNVWMGQFWIDENGETDQW